MLGLKHNANFLVEYDPAWELEFAHEKRRLSNVVEPVARGIEHYGSTAVKGMKAKPILDILIGVIPLEDWEKCHDPLLRLGYDYAANAGVPGHHIFGRGRDKSERTHLVHVVEYMGLSWCSNLAFRDALRRDSFLREAYTAEKQRAIARGPTSRAEYNELKRAFIDTVKASL
ncbi:GrpB family protein [Rhizobium sp. 2YAF20]|uniref:GrpB family protein n=1 Tax=Rhizobium sp. 2YAF20 TaxID=3233027 RepID=UPI003F94AA3C